jgi:predicted RNA-binding Zn ribbon-like protein
MGPISNKVRLPVRLIGAGRPGLCLDYANTLGWRGLERPTEALKSLADLIDWCAGAGLAPEFRAWSGVRRADADALLAEAIALREVIYRIFSALAGGGSSAPADLRALSEAMARAPLRCAIVELGAHYAWQVEPPAGADGLSAPDLLAAVVWSAADLVVGDRRGSVRQCANDRCRWLFLDASRTGSRRWCDMRSCGNRAKARRHYLKHRGA